MTPEAKTKAAVRKVLEQAEAYFFFPPANGYGRAGIPDVVACINGGFLAVECKAGKGRTTALQDRELAHIQDAGGKALVVYGTPEDLQRLSTVVQEMKQKENQ